VHDFYNFIFAVTQGPREVAESEILGDLGRSLILKYSGTSEFWVLFGDKMCV